MELLYILLPNFIILYQVLYFHWNSDSCIENNIVATKSLLATTIDVFVPQCLLNLRESCIILENPPLLCHKT